jgi:hypothetical protein
MRSTISTFLMISLLGAGIGIEGCKKKVQPGEVKDEALAEGRTADSFQPADEDYFHDMDGGISLPSEEIKGRNATLSRVWRAPSGSR